MEKEHLVYLSTRDYKTLLEFRMLSTKIEKPAGKVQVTML